MQAVNFSDPHKQTRSLHLVRDLNIFLILFFFTTFFSFLFFNGSAFWRDLRYALFLNSPLANADLKNGDIIQLTAAANISVSATGTISGATAYATGFPASSLNKLVLHVPKIETTSPIVIPEGTSKSAILASLEGGVGLYPGSVIPGANGRAVLLGHSSKATWYHGDYAYVFTLINHLDPPDEFYVTDGNKKYYYQVFAHRTLSKKDTDELLSGPVNGSEIDLVTCYPIGGASQRTVIQARLIRTEGN
ncbi:MAG: sortase [Candidatus Liptonbacteria bacterium]